MDKRVYRIYRELELNLRIVREKPEPLAVPEAINQCWSMDFMHDQLSDGRSYRLFNVIDNFNREALAIDIDLSLPSERVIQALDQIIEWRRVTRNRTPTSNATIEEVQNYATDWMWTYNHERPNMALGGITPRDVCLLDASKTHENMQGVKAPLSHFQQITTQEIVKLIH